MNGPRKNVTYIGDLMDLDEMHGESEGMQNPQRQMPPPGMQGVPPGQPNPYEKVIRQTSREMYQGGFPGEGFDMRTQGPPEYGHALDSQMWPVHGESFGHHRPEFSCLEIIEHVKGCPLCSKFYSSDSKTVYIIIIVVLAIVCLLLLKRVLEM